MKISYEQVADVTVLRISGKITLGDSSKKFENEIRELVKNGHKRILLDMKEVTYIDQSGIGQLVSAFTTVSNSGGWLKLLNLCKRVLDLMVITKLYTVFDVFDDEAKAVRSFH